MPPEMGIRQQAAEDTGNYAYSDAERITRRSGACRTYERTLANCSEEADCEIKCAFKGGCSSLPLGTRHLDLKPCVRRRKLMVGLVRLSTGPGSRSLLNSQKAATVRDAHFTLIR